MKTQIPSLLMLLCIAASVHAQEPKPSPTAPQASGGGGAMAMESPFRLVRSVSGTKLLQDPARYGVEDPRTVFYAPADKEIIVYFTWEGRPGPHHFEGLWKNPAGRVVMTSEFDYKPEQPRFGGYFKMSPGETPATGLWTLEARIDGESAGAHTFEITTAVRPENVAVTPARRFMTPSEIYNRAAASSVLVENINSKSSRRNIGTGFFIGPGQLLTAFQVIDGATKVRVVAPQSRAVEVVDVLAFNRRQDWIILKVPFDQPALTRATSNSSGVGDRAYFLDVPAEGNRVLVETSLIGKQDLGTSVGERINIADTTNRRAIGSPLLNEQGEVIGMVGGSLLSGAAFLEDIAFGARSNSLGVASRGTLAVPINLVNDAANNTTTIDGLLRAGQFMPALVSTQSVLSGTLARAVNKKADPPTVLEEKIEFSRANALGVVFITWLPKEKRKGYPSLRLYDLDNNLISETLNKKKITVNPNKLSYSLWDLNLATLPAGIYRLDVLLDGDFVWRTFFRMTD